jgi:hypothetical protein
LAGGCWLVQVCSERKVLFAGGWFILREKYWWLVADKPSEQGGSFHRLLSMTKAEDVTGDDTHCSQTTHVS